MADFNDSQFDADLDALARPEPRHGHAAQVLERTSGTTGSPGRDASPRRPSAEPDRRWLHAAVVLRPRWVLPIAATVLAVFGAIWQGDRQLRAQLDRSMASETDRSASGPYPPPDPQLDLPVLPPQAYWGMDAFVEFETLRPGRLAASRPGDSSGSRALATPLPAMAHVTSADDAWTPTSSVAATARSESGPYLPMLPPIDLASIVPAPLVIAPLASLEDIALAEIPVEPIVIAPLIEEERP